MKILWVTNLIIGALAATKGIKSTSGQWLNAELETEIKKNENEIIVCTSDSASEKLTDKNISYIVLPHGSATNYSVTQEKINDWKTLLSETKPDLILVWGTEYNIGKCVLTANEKKIPSLIYIQGVMSSVAENYRGGLSDSQISRFTTLLERIRKTSVFCKERIQEIKASDEKETILLADGIITENDWSANIYKKIASNIKIYRNRLPIKEEFASYSWQENNYETHSIVTTSASYPLKGLHKLLEAVMLAKEKYADIVLYVPGPNIFEVKGFMARLKQSGYCKWIWKYIKKNNLQNNVKFTGPLTTKEYGERMQSSNLFITASAIENHCSSLREAMSVGVPCISSKVGGIPEYAKDRENCSLYDFNDTESLANKITELFENRELREKYSRAGKETIQSMYSPNEKFMSLGQIYKETVK